MNFPGKAKAQQIADEKVIKPVKQAMMVAITAIVVALMALCMALGAI